MPKERTLKGAIDRYKGRDYKLEKQHKAEKEAAKRRQRKREARQQDAALEDAGGVALEAAEEELPSQDKDAESDGVSESGSEGEEHHPGGFDLSKLNDSDFDSDDESDDAGEKANGVAVNGTGHKLNGTSNHKTTKAEEEEDEESTALSDISGEGDNEDIIPHQRLTINNTTALTKALKSISLPYSELPFSEHQTVTTSEPVSIPDVDDDLNRELAFYAQSLSAVQSARAQLKAEGSPFTRPADYFAEMVKSDEHMGKIKSKLMEDAASKRASADARRQRDLKKFGKQVQHEKLQERAKSKREMLDKVKVLKRKRAQGGGAEGDKEEDLFDVALDDAAKPDRREKEKGRGGSGPPGVKRQKKDEKFGFGGKKRGAKRGDAISSGDMSGFSTKEMKGKDGKGGKKRPGKSKRDKVR